MGLSEFKSLEDALQEIFKLRRMNQQLADERNAALQSEVELSRRLGADCAVSNAERDALRTRFDNLSAELSKYLDMPSSDGRVERGPQRALLRALLIAPVLA